MLEKLRRQYSNTLLREDIQSFEKARQASPWEGIDCWLWPGLITKREWLYLKKRFEDLTTKVLTVGQKILDQGQEARWLPSEDCLLEALRDDPASAPAQIVWRFDFIWNRETKEIDVLEVQAGDPSGMGWVDARARDYDKVRAWRKLAEDYSISYPSLSLSLTESVRELCAEEQPAMLFLAARESTVAGDIKELATECQKYLDVCDVRDPRELNSEMLASYSAVYRDTYEELYWPPYRKKAQALIDAYKTGDFILINPLHSNLWDSKALFSELSGEDVLETRRLGDCSLRELTREKDSWVLKPSFHYGGFGIVLGPDCEQSQWEKALAEAWGSPRDWVVQRYSQPQSQEFPILRDGELRWEHRLLTWSAWIHLGKLAGVYLRGSTEKITNVHQGGALMPTFVVEP